MSLVQESSAIRNKAVIVLSSALEKEPKQEYSDLANAIQEGRAVTQSEFNTLFDLAERSFPITQANYANVKRALMSPMNERTLSTTQLTQEARH